MDAIVAEIIADVRARGDAALVELTAKFDRLELDPGQLRFADAEVDAAIATVSEEERQALELAAGRIRAYHARQMPEDAQWTDESGAALGWRWSAVSAAGLYVPGGLASYPLIRSDERDSRQGCWCGAAGGHGANPGRADQSAGTAGCEDCGVSMKSTGWAAPRPLPRWLMEQRPSFPVDKITGPGNAFVAAAKRRVFGKVGIDMIAGPSEILVIADKGNNPDWIALDLMSQAEHDESAQSILVTDDEGFGRAVADAVDKRLETLERRAIAGVSWRDFGAVITVRDLEEAAVLSNRIAPEHLELCVADPVALSGKTIHAGAIFLGQYTPEAIGDYVGGPNHVLPTARSARFSSGLSVMDFLKRTTLSQMTPDALRTIGPAAEVLAKSESLEAHGLSVTARLDVLNK